MAELDRMLSKASSTRSDRVALKKFQKNLKDSLNKEENPLLLALRQSDFETAEVLRSEGWSLDDVPFDLRQDLISDCFYQRKYDDLEKVFGFINNPKDFVEEDLILDAFGTGQIQVLTLFQSVGAISPEIQVKVRQIRKSTESFL